MARFLDKAHDSKQVVKLIDKVKQAVALYQVGAEHS